MKKILALALSLMLILSAFSFATAEALPTFDAIVLGTDYVDTTATIKWLTHRTDLVESGALANYVA